MQNGKYLAVHKAVSIRSHGLVMLRLVRWEPMSIRRTFTMNEPQTKSSESDSLIWLAVIAGIGLIAFIVVPKALSTSRANTCINYLQQIEAVKMQWGLERGQTNANVVVTENDITPYMKLLPRCPAGGIYTIGKLGESPRCSLGRTVTPAHALP